MKRIRQGRHLFNVRLSPIIFNSCLEEAMIKLKQKIEKNESKLIEYLPLTDIYNLNCKYLTFLWQLYTKKI